MGRWRKSLQVKEKKKLRFGDFYNSVPSVLREKGPPERRERGSVPHAGTPGRRTRPNTPPALPADVGE